MEIIITQHAYDRIKERMGLNKAAAERLAHKALNCGIQHGDTKGMLHKYISGQLHRNPHKGAAVRLYGEFAYAFIQEGEKMLLLTIFQIPRNLRSHVQQS